MKDFNLKHLCIISFAISAICYQPANAQHYISSEEIDEVSPLLISILTGLPAQYTVRTYKVLYNTVHTDGEPTVASGAVSIPIGAACESFPMVAYCHGTVLRQLDVPSQNNFESIVGKAFSSTGFIAVAPDYLGLGENPGIHPYIHGLSEATATIDLVHAAREFLETLDGIDDNGELFITGYSQGGHAAMATLQYAEENNLTNSLGIVAGAPCSGPYNLSDSQAAVLLSGEPYSNPGYIVYLLISYELAYQNIYDNLGDIIQSPYHELMPPFFLTDQNEFDMGAVNALLPGELSQLMVDTVLANFAADPNHPLQLALRDNDNYDWTPTVPIRLYYCDGDEQVPFQNSIVTEATMLANGAEDVEAINAMPGANHGGCIIPALGQAVQFFLDLASPCILSSTSDKFRFNTMVAMPNPASGHISFAFSENEIKLVLYDITGRIVMEKPNYKSGAIMDISNLRSGTYIVFGQSHHEMYRSTIVVR